MFFLPFSPFKFFVHPIKYKGIYIQKYAYIFILTQNILVRYFFTFPLQFVIRVRKYLYTNSNINFPFYSLWLTYISNLT